MISYHNIKPSYDNKKIFNEIIVNQNGGTVPFIVSDLESKIKHRVRSKTLTVLCANATSLPAIANTILSRFKRQKTRYDSMQVSVGPGSSDLDELLSLQISDKITIKRNPSVQSGSSPEISSDHFVEGIDMEVHENKRIDFTIYLSPA